MPTGTDAPTLELQHVVKTFGPVVALADGTLSVSPGSIHALIGENGAGKSTLVKIVAGVHQRDSGTFRLGGEDVDFRNTAESKAAGVAVIYQEPTLFPDLSVTENLFMGRQPRGRFGGIDRRAMRDEAVRLFTRLGVRIDPDRPALGLSIADQQIIEIAKAISLDARLLIMDEPTAALSRRRGRAAVRRRPQPPRRGARARLHLPPLRRGLLALRHDHGDAGRRVRLDRRHHRCDPGRDRAPHGRPGRRRPCSRRQTAELGDVVLDVEAPDTARVSSTTSRSRCGPARSSGSPGSSAPAAARSLRAVFGVDAYDSGRGHLRSASALRGTTRAPRSERAWRWCPRIGASRAWSLDIVRSPATSPSSSADVSASFGLLRSGAENAAAATWASRLQVKADALDSEGGTLSRRQPAEGRAREVARHQPEAADHRRADARHRRRHQGGGAPAALRAGRPGHRHPHDLVRAARGARHGRPRARRARGPRSPPSSTARDRDAERRHVRSDPRRPRHERHAAPPRSGGAGPRRRAPPRSCGAETIRGSPSRSSSSWRRDDREPEVPLQSVTGWRDLLLTPVDPRCCSRSARPSYHHAERRPLGRLHPRHHGLPRPGSCSSDCPGFPIVVVVLAVMARRAARRLSTALLVASRRCRRWSSPSGRSTPTADRRALGRQPRRSTPGNLPDAFTNLGSAQRARDTRPHDRRARSSCSSRGCYLRNRAAGRELYAIGSDPAPPSSTACRSARACSRAFVISRRARRARRRLYTARYGTVDSRPGTGLELQAVGRRRHRRRRDLRRQRHGLRRGHRRHAAHHDQPRASDPRHRRTSGSRPSSAC